MGCLLLIRIIPDPELAGCYNKYMQTIQVQDKTHLQGLIRYHIESHTGLIARSIIWIFLEWRIYPTVFYESPFNGDISQWDTSNVTNMSYLFAKSMFNGDVSQWNTSNLTDMSGMFVRSAFNGDISGWDVSRVHTMHMLFRNSVFNGDLSKWNTSINIAINFLQAALTEIFQWIWSKSTSAGFSASCPLLLWESWFLQNFTTSPIDTWWACSVCELQPDPLDPNLIFGVERTISTVLIKNKPHIYAEHIYNEIHGNPLNFREEATPDEIDDQQSVKARSLTHLKSLVHGHIQKYGVQCSLNHIDVSDLHRYESSFTDVIFHGISLNGIPPRWPIWATCL